MTLTLSCALVPGLDSPEHAQVAESLGYERAYFYDSPALYPDVWVALCRAAERTERIVLGPGVTVPSNRHPMTTASAIASLAQLAGPGRVVVAVGTGFTARVAMGQRALTWRETTHYVRTVQGLLRGEVVEWDGAPVAMLHSPGLAPERPLRVSWLIGAIGPKGQEVARQLGDGVIASGTPVPGFDWSALLTFGTVLEEGEDPGSARVLDAAAHAGGVTLHVLHQFGQLPPDVGEAWLRRYDPVAPELRHLAMHRGHLVHVNDYDRPYVTGRQLTEWGLAKPRAGWVEAMAEAEQAGATELVYQPAGADIPRELEAMARAHQQHTDG